MTLTHLHLMLNHLPIIGMVILSLLLLHAFIFKKENLIKIYLWYFAAVALISVPVFFTGDPSAEYLRALFPNANNELIENHETFGYISFIIILVLGVSGLLALKFFKGKEVLPSWFKYSFLTVTIVSVFAISWTAKTGGEIRHSEITSEQTGIK
jgi:hypothetical protein